MSLTTFLHRLWPSAPRPDLPRVAIGAIFKNEAPYILEWVAFHQLVGIGDFFIVDNNSTDGSTRLLEGLDAAGIVHRLPPPPSDKALQLPAYREILARFGGRCDWIAFIDADEFIVPTGKERSFPKQMAAVDRDDVGCVVLNWAVYGSSGLQIRDERPVLERFSWRAAESDRVSGAFKSVVRPAAVVDFTNPHQVRLAAGYTTINIDGLPLEPGRRAGHSARSCWRPFRLNHYVVKSFEEWQVKRAKGRVDSLTLQRDESFFAKRDHRDEQEAFDPKLLVATKRRMRELAAMIA